MKQYLQKSGCAGEGGWYPKSVLIGKFHWSECPSLLYNFMCTFFDHVLKQFLLNFDCVRHCGKFRQMWKNAMETAKACGKHRISAIHKCEEINVQIEETWSRSDEVSAQISQEGKFNLDDACLMYFV